MWSSSILALLLIPAKSKVIEDLFLLALLGYLVCEVSIALQFDLFVLAIQGALELDAFETLEPVLMVFLLQCFLGGYHT